MLKLIDSRNDRVFQFPDDACLVARDAGSGVFDVAVSGTGGCKVGCFDSSKIPFLRFEYVANAVERLNKKISEAAGLKQDSVFVLPSDIIRAMDLDQLLAHVDGRDGIDIASGRDV